MRKRSLSLIVAGVAGVVLLLGGCNKPASPTPSPKPSTPAASSSGTPATPASPTPTPTPIPKSKDLTGIEVQGAKGEAPKITGPWPWAIESTQVKVLDPGTGPKVPSNGTVEVLYHGVTGRSGEVFDENFTTKKPISFPLSGVVKGFKKGLENQNVGSRVLIGMPPEDGYGDKAQGKIQAGDTLLFVVEIVSMNYEKAEGAAVPQKPELPQVSGTAEKASVKVPDGYKAPDSLVVQPIIQGEGKKVVASDTITVAYGMYSAKTGKLIQESYGGKPPSGPLSTLIPAWQKALVDQKLGSRLLIIAPASEAYPDGNKTPSVEKGEPVVFVVDLLAATAPQQG